MRKLFAVTFCALLCSAVVAQTSNSRRTAVDTNANQSQRGVKDAPVFVDALIRTEIDKAEAAREAQQREAEAARSERSAVANESVAKWTALAFVVMLIQAGLFVWQLRLMKRSFAESRGALLAARDAADAAKASADALKRIERAYVFAEVHLRSFTTSVIDSAGDWGNLKASVKFWNHGKTPALITMIRGYPILLEAPPNELLDFDGAEAKLPPSLGIGAGTDFISDLEYALPIDEFSNLKNGVKRIYFVGKMEYTDVLGAPCTTSFCWQLMYRDGGSYVIPTRESGLNRHT